MQVRSAGNRPAVAAANSAVGGRVKGTTPSAAVNVPSVAVGAPQNSDPVSQVGFLVLLVFVFCSASRVFDFVLVGLHIPLVLSIVAACFTLLGGGLRPALQSRVGKLMCLFTLWLIICVPFSSWRGGSFELLRDSWSKNMLVFLMLAGSVTSVARVKKMMIAIALGAACAGALAVVLGHRSYERLSLPSGYLSNANDFAQVLLVGMCFLPVFRADSSNMFRRGIVAAGVVFFLYTILSTGSRAALLTAVLVAVLGTLNTSPMRKLALFGAFFAIGVGTLLLAPDAARSRLATLLGGDQEDMTTLQQVAVDSAEGRKNMLKDSIILTAKHPLFGVGPGQFQSAEADYTHEQGKRASWLETHNVYTQVSSETGIPGLIIFVAAFWTCFIRLSRIRKATRNNPRLQSMYRVVNHLWLGFLAFAVTSFFSSVAYQFYLAVIVGLCAAAIGAAERELAASARRSSTTAIPAERPRQGPLPSGAYARIRG